MSLKFQKIIPTKKQIDTLFLLLKDRKHPISHKTLPSKIDHHNFVNSNPYMIWYILEKNSIAIGSLYIHKDNSIGVNLTKVIQEDIVEIINFIKKNHVPLPPIPSLRRADFFVNIAPDNKEMIKIFRKLDLLEIQRSYII